MLAELFTNFDYYNWIGLPVLIFLSRLGDVSLGTLRHVFIAKGYKSIVPILGFFEVLIWVIMIAQVMKNLNNVACYIAWAGGFAGGTYLGMLIEEKLALGMQVVRIITNQDCDALIEALKKNNHGITLVPAQGSIGPVKIIFTIIKRKDLNQVVLLIRNYNPTAFYSVEDIRDTNQGVFSNRRDSIYNIQKMFPSRKGK